MLGASARVGVLDDSCDWIVEFERELPGGIQIHQVVIGELLAVQLPCAGDAGVAGCVQGSGLMRVFAIAQRGGTRSREAERYGQCGGRSRSIDLRQASGDSGIVGGCLHKGALGQMPARFDGKGGVVGL